MSKKSEYVKKWRRNAKKRIIDSMGGCCQICGYNRCDASLSLHHINPEEKEISIAKIRASPRSWARIVYELKKCVLVCNNCHGELHSGKVFLPENYKKFDDDYIEYKKEHFCECDLCPTCGKMKPKFNKFCSLECSSRSRFKVDWDSVDLNELIKYNSIMSIADKLNVSDSAVRKRLKKIGLK
jgi:hypothetical protein